MTQTVDQSSISAWKQYPLSVRLRAVTRLVAALTWTGGCYLCSLTASGIERLVPPVGAYLRKRISRIWLKLVPRFLGTRSIVKGTPPRPSDFLVINHLSWIDFFTVLSVCNVKPVVEEPMGLLPIMGRLIRGVDAILVRRVKEDTDRVKALMVEELQRGGGLLLAPETPVTTIPRGTGVRMFRAGLIDAAVITNRPVHYASLTYRTPDGYPPASQAIIYGPNPYLRTADGKIPESELKIYGPPKPFMPHLLGVLALPWHEFTITFGEEPISGTERIELANQLHDAVEKNFTPIK